MNINYNETGTDINLPTTNGNAKICNSNSAAPRAINEYVIVDSVTTSSLRSDDPLKTSTIVMSTPNNTNTSMELGLSKSHSGHKKCDSSSDTSSDISRKSSSSKSSSSKNNSSSGYVSRHQYVPSKGDLVPDEVDVLFEWGHNGSLWKINDKNEKEIMHLDKFGCSTIYSDDTFDSDTFTQITFKLKIKKRNSSLWIGIINNVQHKNTPFWEKEIPNNDEMEMKQNMYYCIGASDGMKGSHVTNDQDEACINDSINNGDTLTFRINFKSESISIVKNSGKKFTLFQSIKDIKNTNWRLFVSSYWEDNCVELLSCKGFINYESGTKRIVKDTISKQYFSFWFINACIKNKNLDKLFQNKSKVSFYVVTAFSPHFGSFFFLILFVCQWSNVFF